MKLKMQKYYPVLVSRLVTSMYDSESYCGVAGAKTRFQQWQEYRESLLVLSKRIEDIGAQPLDINEALAWDALVSVTTKEEREEWKRDCNANESHLTALAIAATRKAGML